MDGFWNKRRTERVHFHKRCQTRSVAKVITIFAFCECRAGRRFHASNRGVHFARELLSQERKCQTAKVRTATSATHQYIGCFIHFGQLQQRFFTNNGLVEQHVV